MFYPTKTIKSSRLIPRVIVLLRDANMPEEEKTQIAQAIEDSWQAHVARCGHYVLKTGQLLPAGEIWTLHLALLQSEEGFACLQGSLGLRPNFHQLVHRVEAQVSLTLLACHRPAWIWQNFVPRASRD